MPSITPITFGLPDLKSKSTSNTLLVIMVKAEWCAPCKQIYPKIEELSDNYPGVPFFKVNIDDDDHTDITDFLRPSKVPSFFLYKNGNIVDSIIGTNINKLEDMINQHL